MFKDPTLNKKLREARKKWRKGRPKKSATIRKLEFFNEVKKGKDVTPRNEFEITWVKAYKFREEFKKMNYAQRIEGLREMAKVVVMKGKYFKPGKRLRKRPICKPCHVCEDRMAFHLHHIIMISNGGHDNGINRIPICNHCHCMVHDWLNLPLDYEFNKEYQQMIEMDNT